MNIGGLQKTSLLDYPECISAIVWVNGCNFRCPFCYNKDLVFGMGAGVAEDEVFSFLKKRQGLLDGVVVTGGEPLLQTDLSEFLSQVKQVGYQVKLDTNGSMPAHLEKVLDSGFVDYVAMDVKAPKNKYSQVCGVEVAVADIEQSIQIIKNKAVMYEFRTTFVPQLLTQEDVVAIAEWLRGAKRFYLQQFKLFSPLVGSTFEGVQPYSKEYVVETVEKIKPFFEQCSTRGL
ncbi:MAG: anaerobic ribonucleoside-triphosphate reductase activating protein [Thermoplasmata archaeon M11B2D]|nr:MAG: anaerobic ribonucleoside-triphosphate reductase activating protein [Thermoplasmata archaeon M11B2D]